MRRVTRRDALEISGRIGIAAVGFALADCADGQEARPAAPIHRTRIDEYDPTNTRVGHIVSAAVSDDEILFLQQIGLRSILINFKPGGSRLDEMRRVQERWGRYHRSTVSK